MRKGRKGDQGQYLLYDWHNIITRMSGNAADLLLALNNEVKHESNEEPKVKPGNNNTKKSPIMESKPLEVGK